MSSPAPKDPGKPVPADRAAVSVLLPVRDAAPHLRTCLRSIERQTFSDFEIVAVDDGSTDGSAELLDAWSRRDPRLRVLHRPPLGLVPALQEGLAACRADLVARMDADDEMLPRRLERQVEPALRSDPSLALVSCAVRCVPSRRIAGGFRHYQDWLNRLVDPASIHRERFVESPLAHPTVVFRKDAIEQVGGYVDVPWAEDYDLWLRLLGSGARCAKVPEILHLWRDRPERLTRADPRYARAKFVACKAHHLARGPLRDRPPFLVWGAGQTGRRLVKALRLELGAEMGENCRPLAFLDIDPKKIGRAPYGIEVRDADELPTFCPPEGSPVRRPVVLVAVSRRGAAELIRPRLAAAGWVEGQDAWFCAGPS